MTARAGPGAPSLGMQARERDVSQSISCESVCLPIQQSVSGRCRCASTCACVYRTGEHDAHAVQADGLADLGEHQPVPEALSGSSDCVDDRWIEIVDMIADF